MVKIIFCLRRHPNLTAEQFYSYWLNQHAPLVRKHASSLRIKRYTQSHLTDYPQLRGSVEARGAKVPEYDGVAELWWESLDDLVSVGESEEGRHAGRELLADESKFIDMDNSPIFYTNEHLIIP